MWNYYAKAMECYVYLADVSALHEAGPNATRTEFMQSSWFTRCWTLQELLAPKRRTFCASDWSVLFTLENSSLPKDQFVVDIVARTKIPVNMLLGKSGQLLYSVAQKMSWAAKRTATRTEDVAYSLLGLFQVNMPLLYGEGSLSYQRLQYEIIKQSADESIFAWKSSEDPSALGRLLALEPACFTGCGKIFGDSYFERPPYAITQQRLTISGHDLRRPGRSDGFGEVSLFPLNCKNQTAPKIGRCMLVLAVDGMQRFGRIDISSQESSAERELRKLTLTEGGPLHGAYELHIQEYAFERLFSE